MVKSIVLFSLLLITGISACNKGLADAEQEPAERIIRDVSYGTDSAQRMDVYLPAARNSSQTKVLVFIHGGSWSSGDKEEFNDAIAAIRPRLNDYAIFNINYRVASGGRNRYPTQVNDVQAALNFIKNKSTEYLINPDKVGLIGASAGGHLALLQAYKFNTDGRIKAVVDLFGPTDLLSLYNTHPFPTASRPVLVNLLGATPTADMPLYAQASPINFVTGQSAPTLILHGELDIINPISQSIALRNKLQQANAKVEMITYTGEGHGWLGNNLLDTYNRAVTFIQQNVQ